jgi:tyrosine-protein phosphatase SIW14
MRLVKGHTVMLVLSAAVWPLLGKAGQRATASRLIPKFAEVVPDLYRGGQPRKGGFEYLKRIGVKTVINLRGENGEKKVVQGLGMKYVQIPMGVLEDVPDAKIQEFFSVLRERENYPVFVHCRRGADRTGFMVGLYRIAFEGWTAGQSYQEARDFGMRWWYWGLKHQLYVFAAKQQNRAVKPSHQ